MGMHSTDTLVAHGIEMPVPAAVHVRDDVPLERIAREGVVLHPGVRIGGPRSLLLAGARVGQEGPAVLENVALGRGASVASGSVEDATLLAGASLGPDAHVRPGTLLEEEASTGHAVGLKQTILLGYATLGSLINFCDCLLAGGTSRKDHSEVGSGFIHFNFTPFGKSGDKATASLFGDVTRGVFLREKRIFLGGSGGVVGPSRIAYGCVLAAGSVYRKDYAADLLVFGEKPLSGARSFDPLVVRRADRKAARSLRYVAELRALEAFYRFVRLPRSRDSLETALIEAGLTTIEAGIHERLKQTDRFLDGAGSGGDPEESRRLDVARERWAAIRQELDQAPEGPGDERAQAAFLAGLGSSAEDHPSFVKAMSEELVALGQAWLDSIVRAITALYPEA